MISQSKAVNPNRINRFGMTGVSGFACVLSRVYGGVQSHPDVPRQGAVRRKWHVLFKGCNNVLEHLGGSLRAGREAVTRGVTPLGKD